MKRYTAFLMAGALILALSITAAAQYDTQSPQTDTSSDMTRTVMGTVVSVSASSLVIKTDSGDQMIFTRDANSTVPVMVSAGSTVRVDYETPQPGVFHVSNVLMNAGASDMTSQRDAKTSTTPAAEPTTPAAKATTSAARKTDRANESTTTGSEAMPKTASPLPLVGLLGLMALGGAVTIHSLNRR